MIRTFLFIVYDIVSHIERKINYFLFIYLTYFIPRRTLFQFLCPIAQQAGQAAVLGRLSLSVCLWC